MVLETSLHSSPLAPIGTPGVSYAVTENIGTFLIKCAYHLYFIGGLVVFSPSAWLSQDLQGTPMCILKLRPSRHCRPSLIFTNGKVILFSIAQPACYIQNTANAALTETGCKLGKENLNSEALH